MKKRFFSILLALFVLVAAFPVGAQAATDTIPAEGLYIEVFDSYGDAWNGAAIYVFTDSEYVGRASVDTDYEGSFVSTAITASLIETPDANFIKVVPESEIDDLIGTPLAPGHFIIGYKES